jgi:SAM-dependent methyltransferase
MSKTAELLKIVKVSLKDDLFVKLVLSAPSNNKDMKKVTARQVQIKGEDMLSIVTSLKTSDITKNYSISAGLETLRKHMENSFNNTALFTSEADYRLKKDMSGKERIVKSPPTIQSSPDKSHDHSKKRLISKDRPFLKTLGLVSQNGEIKTKMNGKYNQIESFTNILANTLKGSDLKEADKITAYDMGAGSGYVTFAIYEYITQTLGKEINLVGVDINSQLVERNNTYAKELGFGSLSFVKSSIGELSNIHADIVVALHACNTSTDDAIFAGIQSDSEIIIVSPCCHQELRTKMKTPKVLTPMHKFGTHKELEAVMLTDTIRTLILEINGFKTSLFEFVSDEHSGKNNIIVAVKKQSNQNVHKFVTQLSEIKEFYGITEDLYLESLFIK